ncbi:MAG: hypothetical protein PUB39_02720 [Eubacteriales bacterium]|nr:hypothetical protein [Eubacteriales bacterium]
MGDTLASHDDTIREPLFLFLEGNYGRIRILEEVVIGRPQVSEELFQRDYNTIEEQIARFKME